MSLIVVAFYEFVALPDCRELRPRLLRVCRTHGLVGTVILAAEGINGSLAGPREAVGAVMAWLRADPRLCRLEGTTAAVDTLPFLRLKVVVKREIVALRRSEVRPDHRTGARVAPRDWNQVLRDPDVVVLDCRNEFEVGVGTFRGALNPRTTSFSDFPEFVRTHLDPRQHPRVAMFCTGGIRCEKASSFMLDAGFEDIAQLHGGVLRYLAEVSAEESLWQGDCFVFDRRVAVGHGLAIGDWRECRGCRHPVSPADTTSPMFEDGVSCPRCHPILTEARRRGLRERARQMRIAAARGRRHLAPCAMGVSSD